MYLIAILVGKITILVGKLFKRGSSLPGKIALKIDKNLLAKLKYPQNRIVITGSSGKGTTSSLIAKSLTKNGYKVCHNSTGSNLSFGITTSLIKCSSLTGKIKTDYLVLEIDERYNKEVLTSINPTLLVITNLTKDQPPRQHTIDIVYKDIIKSIPEQTKILTTMDDPFLRYLNKDLPNEINYFSLKENKYSYHNQIFENLNTTTCPNCDSKLIYDYYNFENLGSYHCSNCDFSYYEPDTIGKNLDLEKETIEIDNEIINLGSDTLYQAYNVVSAFAALKLLGLSNKKISTTLNEINTYKDEYFDYQNKKFRYFNCKSENATTFNSAIFKIKDDKDLKDIIIGYSIISKRYPHTDASWLYDIEFELLNNKSLNNIYVCGLQKHELETRLILAGIPKAKIIIKEDLPSMKEDILKSKSLKVYCLSHYDYGDIFKNTFKEEN